MEWKPERVAQVVGSSTVNSKIKVSASTRVNRATRRRIALELARLVSRVSRFYPSAMA